ncbi:MAG: pyrroloquinoline quinone biosynthesis protein PqqB [Vulcanimicrobiaceae bacterium]
MILRVLGSAAGGGVPQWNCACANCSAARAGLRPRRLQSSVAVSADAERWTLLNCSPDIAQQIEGFPALQPRATRDTPIVSMLLTDANVDHIGGLATLRQRGSHRFIVRSSAVVRAIACAQPAFAPFACAPHQWIDVTFDQACPPVCGEDPVGNAIEVRAFAVPGTTPGYSGRRHIEGAVVAYELRDKASGANVLFAPVFSSLSDSLRTVVQRADVAFLDGTFFTDAELVEENLMDKRARDLGHLPVGSSDGSLAALNGHRGRIVFTHVNNSNPMLDPDSNAAVRVRSAGAEIAYDGMEVRL